MNKEIILKYLQGECNEEDVICALKEHKTALANPKNALLAIDEGYFSLLCDLIENSPDKVKYHAIIIVSNPQCTMNASQFNKMCKIAAESLASNDGNVRYAGGLLVKNINYLMRTLPVLHLYRKPSNEEVNVYYESFRDLFHALYAQFYSDNEKIKKSVLTSLEIIIPKIQDMAEFAEDEEEKGMVNELTAEIDKQEGRKQKTAIPQKFTGIKGRS